MGRERAIRAESHGGGKKKKNEEQLEFHSSVWIGLGQNPDETVQEPPSRSIRGKREREKKKSFTLTLWWKTNA